MTLKTDETREFQDISSLRLWYRGNSDGVALNTTPSPDQLQSVDNEGSLGGTVENTDTDEQPLPSELHGLPSILADGADDALVTSLARSAMKFTHGDSGVTWVFFVQPNDDSTGSPYLFTTAVNASGIGVICKWNSTTGKLFFWLCNGSGAYVAQLNSGATTIESGRRAVVVIRYKTGETNEAEIFIDGVSVATTDLTGTVSTSDSSRDFSMLARDDAASPFGGHLPELLCFAEYLSDAECRVAENYLDRVWGSPLEAVWGQSNAFLIRGTGGNVHLPQMAQKVWWAGSFNNDTHPFEEERWQRVASAETGSFGRTAMVRFGVSATSLARDWLTGADLYDDAEEHLVRAAEACPIRQNVTRLLWFQGEADAGVEADANAYETNLDSLCSKFRTKFGDVDVVVIRLHAENPSSYASTVRAKQDAWEDNNPGNHLLNCDDLELEADNVHYTDESLTAVLERFRAVVV